MNLTPFDLSKLNINESLTHRKMSEILEYFSKQKGVGYISCDPSFLGGGDIGRYLTHNGMRMILIANSYIGFSVSEQLDTIIHESIHCAGEEWILGRTDSSPIDKNDISYWFEEYIALRATNIVCSNIGIYNMDPQPTIGDAATPTVFNMLRKYIKPEGFSELEHFIDAASQHILKKKLKS